MPEIKAVIFDMDGLLLDTERIGRAAWKQAAGEFGFIMEDHHYGQIVGRRVSDAKEVLSGIYGLDFPFYTIRERRVEIADQILAIDGVPVKNGARELLEWLSDRKMPLAVATSSMREPAMHHLTQSELLPFFETVVSGDQVKNGKPAPDIFLEAAKRLGVAAENSLVLEDSPFGVIAAKAAAATVIMIPDLRQPDDDLAPDAVFSNLSAVQDWLGEREEMIGG